MAVIKCPVCGGELDLNDDATIGKCRYCDSTIAVPKNFEKKQNLYNRATFYRQSNEYDKAIEVYEDLLKEDSKDAEAHFGLLLSKYGIEYVQDPKTGERKPTCHRLQKTSILNDSEYVELLECADSSSKYVYEEKINEIAEIQERILKISKTEPPYDIFICYKETDDNGDRTADSVLAQDIYNELKKKYKVFFARKTLESKLGGEYEPIIFAALNSAKVMVVVGTKKENFEAVWVKNEWSRFLAMTKDGFDKTTIPVYKDISPYELPMELSNLQGLDASKIGFMQDLADGIEKCVKSSSVNKDKKVYEGSSIDKLIHNGDVSIELGEFNKAKSYYKKAVDDYPDDYRGWEGLLFSSTANLTVPLKDNKELENNIRVWNQHLKKLCSKSELAEIKDKINKICRRNEKRIDDIFVVNWYYWIMCDSLDWDDIEFNTGRFRTYTKNFSEGVGYLNSNADEKSIHYLVYQYAKDDKLSATNEERKIVEKEKDYLEKLIKCKTSKDYAEARDVTDVIEKTINNKKSIKRKYYMSEILESFSAVLTPTILCAIAVVVSSLLSNFFVDSNNNEYLRTAILWSAFVFVFVSLLSFILIKSKSLQVILPIMIYVISFCLFAYVFSEDAAEIFDISSYHFPPDLTCLIAATVFLTISRVVIFLYFGTAPTSDEAIFSKAINKLEIGSSLPKNIWPTVIGTNDLAGSGGIDYLFYKLSTINDSYKNILNLDENYVVNEYFNYCLSEQYDDIKYDNKVVEVLNGRKNYWNCPTNDVYNFEMGFKNNKTVLYLVNIFANAIIGLFTLGVASLIFEFIYDKAGYGSLIYKFVRFFEDINGNPYTRSIVLLVTIAAIITFIEYFIAKNKKPKQIRIIWTLSSTATVIFVWKFVLDHIYQPMHNLRFYIYKIHNISLIILIICTLIYFVIFNKNNNKSKL